jgi:hypothetical protein
MRCLEVWAVNRRKALGRSGAMVGSQPLSGG